MSYRFLDETLGEIRLLRLIPRGSTEEPLRCSLEHHSLATNVDWYTLSYPWGDSHNTTTLLLDDTVVNVTYNLVNALSCLESLGVELVWADALCINQANPIERGREISRMATIYKNARLTYVFLPAERDSTQSQVVSAIKDLQNAWHSHSAMDGLELVPLDVKPLDTIARSMAPLFSNPYWSRTWILQELALSKEVTALYGPSQFSIRSLHFLINSLARPKRTYLELLEQLPSLRQVADVLNLEHQRLSLIEALHLSHHCKSTNDRDCVYALWGLAHDAKEYHVEPSYTLPTLQLCSSMTQAFIRRTHSLDMLPILSSLHGSTELPSWVPNWFERNTWATSGRSNVTPPYFIPGMFQTGDPLPWWTLGEGFKSIKFGHGKDVDRASEVHWYAHGFVRAKCTFSHDGKVLTTMALFLGIIGSCSGLGQERFAPSGGHYLRPESLRTRGMILDALLFLFTLAYDPPSHVPKRIHLTLPWSKDRRLTLWNSRESTVSNQHFLPSTSYRSLRMEGIRQSAEQWFFSNRDLAIFDLSLHSALKHPWTDIRALWDITSWVVKRAYIPTIIGALIASWRDTYQIAVPIISGLAIVIYCLWLMMPLLRMGFSIRNMDPLHSDGTKFKPLPDILAMNMRLASGEFGLGWVHARAVQGDAVVLLPGCSVPLVLRSRNEGGWTLVGDAIVAGAMKGEMMNESKCQVIDIH